MTFSEQLKVQREKKGLTMRQVSNALLVKYTTYVNWENGKEPGIETLIRLAKFFNITVDELLGNTGEQTKPADKTRRVEP